MSDKIDNNINQGDNIVITEKKIKKKSLTYDGLFKNYMDTLPDETVKKFLFCLFGINADIDLSGELVRLQQETFNDTQKRICDLFYRIGDFYFCVELQLINDNFMAMRVFEYSFRGAILHGAGDSTAGHVTIKFPEPAVIYLQSTESIPDKIVMELDFVGNKIQYEAKVRKLSDYDVDDLFEQYAFPLISFYPLKYEKELKKKHTAAFEKSFIDDMAKIIKNISESAKNGILDYPIAQDIINSMLLFIDEVSEKGGLITDKEALNSMEQLRTIEVVDLNDYYNVKNEGKAEERKKVIMRMTANGFTPANIAKLVDMPTADVRKIISANRKEIAGMSEKTKAKGAKKTTAAKRTKKKSDE